MGNIEGEERGIRGLSGFGIQVEGASGRMGDGGTLERRIRE